MLLVDQQETIQLIVAEFVGSVRSNKSVRSAASRQGSVRSAGSRESSMASNATEPISVSLSARAARKIHSRSSFSAAV